MTVERLLDKFIPSQAQVKEVFNTIPQYAFQVSSRQCRCWDCWGSIREEWEGKSQVVGC